MFFRGSKNLLVPLSLCVGAAVVCAMFMYELKRCGLLASEQKRFSCFYSLVTVESHPSIGIDLRCCAVTVVFISELYDLAYIHLSTYTDYVQQVKFSLGLLTLEDKSLCSSHESRNHSENCRYSLMKFRRHSKQ